MTTGRINQVATVVLGVRPGSVVRPASRVVQRSRSSRRTRQDDQTSVVRSLAGARTDRASAEAAAVPIAGAIFSRLRGTRCGAGILKTVRLVTNLDVWHNVRISTARQNKSTDETLAGPLARWPGSQPGVFEIASESSIARRSKSEPSSPSLDAALTEQQPYRRHDARKTLTVDRTVDCLSRCQFARCTAASRIKQSTVWQALFHPNIPVCTLCFGFKRPICLPYSCRRINSLAGRA